jgi:hypothetical protein
MPEMVPPSEMPSLLLKIEAAIVALGFWIRRYEAAFSIP